MGRSWVGILVVAIVAWAGNAKADPYTHDGFQFRGTIGGGYLHDSESVDGASIEGKVSGGAALIELYLGGSPVPGLVLGGFLSGMSAPGPTFEVNGVEGEANDDTSLGCSGAASGTTLSCPMSGHSAVSGGSATPGRATRPATTPCMTMR